MNADSLFSSARDLKESGRDALGAVKSAERAAEAYLSSDLPQLLVALKCHAQICAWTKLTPYASHGLRSALVIDSVLTSTELNMSDTDASFIRRNAAALLIEHAERDRAAPHALAAMEHARRTGDTEAIDQALEMLSFLYKETGDYAKALELSSEFVESTKLRLSGGNLMGIEGNERLSDGYTIMAECFQFLGDFRQAINHGRSALAHERKARNSPMRINGVTVNLANACLYYGYLSGTPEVLDSCIVFSDEAIRVLEVNGIQRPDLRCRAAMWKVLALQIQGHYEEARLACRACPRDWLAQDVTGSEINWDSPEAPTMEELDGWSCAVDNFFMEAGDSSMVGQSIRMHEHLLQGFHHLRHDIDPGSMSRDMVSALKHNSRYLHFLWRSGRYDWNELAGLFELRRADQLRTWLASLANDGPPGAARSGYFELLGKRDLLLRSPQDERVGKELAMVSAALDSVRRVSGIGPAGDLIGLRHTLPHALAAIDDSTLIMNYAWSDDENGKRLFILSLSRDERQFERRENTSWLEDALHGFSRAAVRSGTGSIDSLAKLLGDSLLPSSFDPYRHKNIIVIPDGPLTQVPFELLSAVRGSTREALIDLAQVRYEHGLGFLSLGNTRPGTTGLLACAPAFDGAENGTVLPLSVGASSGLLRNGLAPLTANKAEAEELVVRHGAHGLIGPMASEANVRLEMDGYSVIHFASHAVCSDSIPELSGILLAGAKAVLKDTVSSNRGSAYSTSADNILHAHEIPALKLTADMVVLSACVTGVGQERLGEGPLSLARSFRLAGVPNVISSLWKVDDLATKEIMVKFYEFLAEGMGKADALAEAKRWYRRTYPNEPPSKWAAFILIGDNEPVHLKKRSPVKPWMVGGAIAAAAAVVLARRRRRMSA
ncbi:MAG: CHAT domain-containing protein [Flavobacteriales bacterium]|nr:CHAT domain-containing protein [Flavobacteriales bacterium]